MKIIRFKHFSIFAIYWKLTEKCGFFFFGGKFGDYKTQENLFSPEANPLIESQKNWVLSFQFD
jgi:hypothetical protein